MKPNPMPFWMRPLLIAAGVYNLLWGMWAICWPQAYFHSAGMPEINYPQIWQCVGMIVGVYGLGYIIAAQNPVRHWPIILVGFLGKLLGPIGFLQNAIGGALPWKMGWVNVTNDLIWLVPFALILHHAWQVERRRES